MIGGNGAGKSTTAERSGRCLACGQRQASSLTAWMSPGLPEHKRAKYIGRVFQDPMTGTAATMQIEENLALATPPRQDAERCAPASPKLSARNTGSC